MDNRFPRIDAADTIKYLAENKFEMPIPLEVINEHLMDCCASVRLSLIQALLYIGDNSSVENLEKLSLLENESKLVRDNCNMVLEVLKSAHPYMKDRELYYDGQYNDRIIGLIRVNKENDGSGTVIYVGESKDGNAEGVGKLYDKYSGELIYEGEFIDNIFNGKGKSNGYGVLAKCEGTFLNGIFSSV